MIEVRKALEIGRVNLLRQARDRRDAFFVFVLPTIIIVALGLQFGGPQQARIGVVAPAGDPAAAALVAALSADELDLEIRTYADEAQLRSRVEHGELEAGVVIPAGFDAALRGTGTAQVRYLGTNDAFVLGLRAPIESAIARIATIATATRVAVGAGAGDWDAVSAVAAAGYDRVPGVTVAATRVGEEGLFAGFSQFTFGASTQLIMFMFLTSMTAATGLVLTRQLGVSRRMLSTPTSAGTIVVGEALGRFAVALLQAVYVVLVTAIAFGVSWGDPLAAGTIIALFAVISAGVAMLVGALVKNADQAGSLGVFIGLTSGALGGCMIPLQTMPDSMQTVARLLPHSWALLGLQSLIRDGGGLASVGQNLAVLAAYAAVLLALASWRFRKAIAG